MGSHPGCHKVAEGGSISALRLAMQGRGRTWHVTIAAVMRC